MATGTPYLAESTYHQAIIWNWDRFYNSNQEATGAVVYNYGSEGQWFAQSGTVALVCLENKDVLRKIQSTNDNLYIKLEQSFKQQTTKLPDIYGENCLHIYKPALSNSISSLLSLNPDVISLQVTREKSVFYTIVKDDVKIYFEHFLGELDEDEDEAIFTLYRNNSTILNFGGSLSEAISKLDYCIAPEKQVNIELIDELSY